MIGNRQDLDAACAWMRKRGYVRGDHVPFHSRFEYGGFEIACNAGGRWFIWATHPDVIAGGVDPNNFLQHAYVAPWLAEDLLKESTP